MNFMVFIGGPHIRGAHFVIGLHTLECPLDAKSYGSLKKMVYKSKKKNFSVFWETSLRPTNIGNKNYNKTFKKQQFDTLNIFK